VTLRARLVPVAANPLDVARSLSGEPGFVFLWSASSDGASYAACWPRSESASLDPEPELPLAPGESSLAAFPRWIGLLPYECRRGIERPSKIPAEVRPEPHLSAPLWRRYGAVARIQNDVVVAGDDAAAVAALSARIASAVRARRAPLACEALPSDDTDAAHAARISRALSAIVEGEIYQVNLARRFDFRLTGGALELLERLVGKARSPFALAFEGESFRVAASSPELFLSLGPRGELLTLPIKGTRPRGADARADSALADALENDPKERAELSMVVDVERNDLGRVARIGSVRATEPPRVEAFGAVWHRTASVRAALRPGTTRTELLEAMLPSGSVTGAPKIRAMELIASLEAARRGLYTGAFGFLSHEGGLRLGMAIRTVTAKDEIAHYFAGGGIVFGSEPAREVLETRWKAAQILRLVDGGKVASGGSP
jgi:anthranilate/para-aminobenzoate synthase component I